MLLCKTKRLSVCYLLHIGVFRAAFERDNKSKSVIGCIVRNDLAGIFNTGFNHFRNFAVPSNNVNFHCLCLYPGTGPGRRVISLTRYKCKDIFLISKTFYTIFQKSWPGTTIFGSQRTVPAANACSNAASVAACRPNWNQCLYLARLAKTRQTPWASRAMYALTLFSILAFHPWFNQYPISVLGMFTFDVFQRFRRVKPTATVFRAGPGIHRAQ